MLSAEARNHEIIPSVLSVKSMKHQVLAMEVEQYFYYIYTIFYFFLHEIATFGFVPINVISSRRLLYLYHQALVYNFSGGKWKQQLLASSYYISM